MYPAAEIVVSFLFAALYYGASALNETKPVYFSLIISGGENGSFRSSGGIPSIDIALEAIQSRRILPGYNLTYDRVRNSKVLLARLSDIYAIRFFLLTVHPNGLAGRVFSRNSG